MARPQAGRDQPEEDRGSRVPVDVGDEVDEVGGGHLGDPVDQHQVLADVTDRPWVEPAPPLEPRPVVAAVGHTGPPRLKSSAIRSSMSSRAASTWWVCMSSAGCIALSISRLARFGRRRGPRPWVPFWRGATYTSLRLTPVRIRAHFGVLDIPLILVRARISAVRRTGSTTIRSALRIPSRVSRS